MSFYSSFFFVSVSDFRGSQTTQTWDFCKATEKLLSHPTLNIHKAFFEIGKAFRVAGVYGLVFSLTHNHCLLHFPLLRSYSLGLFALYNGLLSTRGSTWLGGEEKVESGKGDEAVFCSQ